MANTLAAIIATGTDAAQIVSREPTGFVDAIDFRPDLAGATLNSTVNLGIVALPTERAWSPGIATTLADSTEGNVTLTLSNAYEEVFHLTGEQIQGLSVGNFNAKVYLQTKFAQAFRQLRNRIDAYIATIAKQSSSRAVGTAGTVPFASNLDLTADLRRILEQNGAPVDGGEVSLVVDPFAAANVRKLLGTPTAAAGALAADMQRPGMLPMHNGLQFRVSQQIITHTKGTGTAYTATIAQGGVDATLAAGSNTYVPGDVLTFAGDTNAYICGVSGSATGAVAKFLNRPGALSAKAGAAMTIGNNYMPHIALHRNSIACVVRPPAQVPNDLAQGAPRPFLADVITDPVNGMPYGLYVQVFDGGVHFSIRAIYGAVGVNLEHIATCMG